MSIAGHVSRAMRRVTPTCGWKPSGAPSTRSPHGSRLPTRSVRRKVNGGGRVRECPNRPWFSNSEASAIDEGVACQRLAPVSCGLNCRRQIPHAHEVVSSGREGENPPDFEYTAVPCLSQHPDRLHPTEHFLNLHHHYGHIAA